MKLTLTGANIVVLADSHNPSIASKDWLLSNGVFVDEPEKFIHSPVLALYESARFVFTVDQKRFQVVLKKPELDALKELPEIVKRYVERLPQTPYRAVGLNYLWNGVAEEGEEPVQALKTAFVGNPAQVGWITAGAEWTIGGILKWTLDPFVIRLVVEPTQEPVQGVNLDFNYHRDVRGTSEVLDSNRMFQSNGAHSHGIAKVVLGIKDG